MHEAQFSHVIIAMTMNVLYSTCSWIGAFGPPLSALLIMSYIFEEGLHGWGFFLLVLWQPLNIFLNEILKWVIHEKRPKNSRNVNDFERLLEGGPGHYGMPSGHAQLVSSSVVFAYTLGLPNTIVAICIVQMLITLWQRYIYRKHTKLQLAFGLLAGAIYSFFFSKFIEKDIDRNSLKLNDDSNM